MASACVNNIGMSPDTFLDCPATYPWLTPSRISFSRDHTDESKLTGPKPPPPFPEINHQGASTEPPSDPDPEVFTKDFGDFEFRLEDPVTMLPADELFSDGKLMPLHLSMIPPPATTEISSPETIKSHRRSDVSSMPDPYLFSPKAPRCSSRWKELLGLKKLYLNANANKQDGNRTMSSSLPSHTSHNSKSFKNFLHRKSSIDSSLSLPLLKDSDIETISISSRLSLSSSSSGHEHDDLPRLSLDSEKPSINMCPKNPNLNSNNPPRVRLVKHKALSSENPTRIGRSPMRRAPDSAATTAAAARGVSVDSPRMNSSGKIVFQGLERSSSSPSSLNGGPRFKHRGMERSYSSNVRVTPVLNVPVCSLRGSSKSSVFGFQLFSSQQKREVGPGGGNGVGNRGGQQSNFRNRTVDRA
ncbi:uncharacterized protein LOC131321864 [Rhododendron vialii]|uniref:uncharacterized protein LOC131321864 n=1 Tax=Rhododendron vialii TaxID=182163 RepID=UPI00265F19DE|nr:uncharacterized protein LOC131321864 [Rhododendron vialii]